MLIALWIINALLALAFVGAGAMKVASPKPKLAASGMGWTDDFGGSSIKLIGAAEVLGGLGLIIPLATGVATALTPIAAVCLAIVMVGATVVHARRHEPVTIALVLALLSIVSAVLGFLVVTS